MLPTLKIAANQRPQEMEIVIEDTGAGNLDIRQKESSSGQGLVLHSTMMAVIGGELAFEQVPEQSARVVLRVPLTS